MLTRWNPFGDLMRWDEEFQPTRFSPAVDVVEQEGAYLLKVEVPGLKPEEVDVSIEGSQLTISGERKQEHEESREGYQRIERSFGSFSRSFTLPENVSMDDIDASLESGVLQVRIPKTQKAQRRRVAIGAKQQPAQPKQVTTQGEAQKGQATEASKRMQH